MHKICTLKYSFVLRCRLFRSDLVLRSHFVLRSRLLRCDLVLRSYLWFLMDVSFLLHDFADFGPASLISFNKAVNCK